MIKWQQVTAMSCGIIWEHFTCIINKYTSIFEIAILVYISNICSRLRTSFLFRHLIYAFRSQSIFRLPVHCVLYNTFVCSLCFIYLFFYLLGHIHRWRWNSVGIISSPTISVRPNFHHLFVIFVLGRKKKSITIEYPVSS